MEENILDLKFGNEPGNIKKILLERTSKKSGNEIEKVYIILNALNGKEDVMVYDRDESMTPNEFYAEAVSLLKSLKAGGQAKRGETWDAKTYQENKKEFDKYEAMFEDKSIPAEVVEDDYDLDSEEEENEVQYNEENMDPSKNYKIAAGVATAAIVLVGLSAALSSCNKKPTQPLDLGKSTVETSVTDTKADEEQDYGFYRHDLSSCDCLEDALSKYEDMQSSQLTRASDILEAGKGFNSTVTLTDGTEVIGGLTLDQLNAYEIYSNLNNYSDIEMINRIGLKDLSNIQTNFQDGVLAAAAYLSDPSISGEALINLIKDEYVKSFAERLDEYSMAIKNAENDKEVKENAEKINELFRNTLDRASGDFIDYDKHPGMAWIVSAYVTSLDSYNNVALNKKVVQDIIIIGKDGEFDQSKIDSICAVANERIDGLKDKIKEVKTYLENNKLEDLNKDKLDEATKFALDNFKNLDTLSEMDKAKVLGVLNTTKGMAALVRNNLFDDLQLDVLVNKSLENDLKKVNELDQDRIVQDTVIKIQQAILDASKGHFKDEKTKQTAQQLQKKGDTAKVDEGKQNIPAGSQAAQEIGKTPEGQAAQQQAYQEMDHDASDGSIETDAQHESQDVQQLQQQAQLTFEQLRDLVINYYHQHGPVEGIPAELQVAYNTLDHAYFETCKQTGIARYNRDHNPQYVGGEITYTQVDEKKINEETAKAEKAAKEAAEKEAAEKAAKEKAAKEKAEKEAAEKAAKEAAEKAAKEAAEKAAKEAAEKAAKEAAEKAAKEAAEKAAAEKAAQEAAQQQGQTGGEITYTIDPSVYEITDISTEAEIDAYINSLEGVGTPEQGQQLVK